MHLQQPATLGSPAFCGDAQQGSAQEALRCLCAQCR